MDFNELNDLERIGLAFVAGVITGTSLEYETEKEPKHLENEKDSVEKIEIKKVSSVEMAEILKGLENKILGGKN